MLDATTLLLLQVHRLSGTLVQAGVYQQQLSNLTLLVAFIDAHKHAQAVLRDHIQVGEEPASSLFVSSFGKSHQFTYYLFIRKGGCERSSRPH